MKEERRRQKQLEANFEEEYFEDHGGEEFFLLFMFLCVCAYILNLCFWCVCCLYDLLFSNMLLMLHRALDCC